MTPHIRSIGKRLLKIEEIKISISDLLPGWELVNESIVKVKKTTIKNAKQQPKRVYVATLQASTRIKKVGKVVLVIYEYVTDKINGETLKNLQLRQQRIVRSKIPRPLKRKKPTFFETTVGRHKVSGVYWSLIPPFKPATLLLREKNLAISVSGVHLDNVLKLLAIQEAKLKI